MSRSVDYGERSLAGYGEFLLSRLPPLLAASNLADHHQALLATRRLIAHLREFDPRTAEQLNARLFGPEGSLGGLDSRRGDLLGSARAAPVDREGSQPLLRMIKTEEISRPAMPKSIDAVLDALLLEHKSAEQLLRGGLTPRCTVLLSGPPGVGKTMLAQWLASRMGLPLAQIELSAAISSFLGRTGQNIKELMDYARRNQVVLLLDEFDAIAKRRDDQSDLGELKRVVSVLLKELEEWTGPSIIIAATNHKDLIDSAIFRRFQLSIEVPLPDALTVKSIIKLHLGACDISDNILCFAADLLANRSGSNVRDIINSARRDFIINNNNSFERYLLMALGSNLATLEQRRQFCKLAIVYLSKKDSSYARLAEMLGVSKTAVSNYIHV